MLINPLPFPISQKHVSLTSIPSISINFTFYVINLIKSPLFLFNIFNNPFKETFSNDFPRARNTEEIERIRRRFRNVECARLTYNLATPRVSSYLSKGGEWRVANDSTSGTSLAVPAYNVAIAADRRAGHV